jgi:hypothetical protein
MGKGERLNVCADCWNRSVYARKAARKQQLAEHWQKYRAEQKVAMDAAGAQLGDSVQYFCRSMLGFGGLLVTGTITANRNGIAVIRLDRIVDGKRFAQWNKAWNKAAKTNP